MINRVLRVGLSYWCLWDCVDRLSAVVLLSSDILVSSCCIDGIFGLLNFIINFSLSRILLLASQGVVGFDCCLLVVSCLIDCVLRVSFRCWRLWNCVDGLRAFGLLSSDVFVGCRCVDGILSFLGFFVDLSLSCIFFLTS